MTTETAKKQPIAIYYFVPEEDGAAWTRCGALFAHDDGKGFTPVYDEIMKEIKVKNGRFTYRAPKDDPQGAAIA